jgi:hypothetical protein
VLVFSLEMGGGTNRHPDTPVFIVWPPYAGSSAGTGRFGPLGQLL